MDIVQELKGEIAVLREKVKSLEETIQKVALKANDNEQYSRRQNVRVTGFAEEKTKVVLLNLYHFAGKNWFESQRWYS